MILPSIRTSRVQLVQLSSNCHHQLLLRVGPSVHPVSRSTCSFSSLTGSSFRRLFAGPRSQAPTICQMCFRRQISFSSFFFRAPPPPPSSSSGKNNQRKIESYFNAIGGQSDDPPPDLTPEQVIAILRTHESLIFSAQTASENEKFIENFSDAMDNTKSKKQTSAGSSSSSSSGGRTKTNKNQAKISELQNNKNKKFYSLIDNQWLTSVESNQLASNHPIEDRIRISSLNLDSIFESSLKQSTSSTVVTHQDQCIGFGVFDGHNGGLCADIISRRLFHYIAIALKVIEIKRCMMSNDGDNQSGTDPVKFVPDMLSRITTDHVKSPSPKFYYNLAAMYDANVADNLRERIEQFELDSLEMFAQTELAHVDQPDQSESELISGAIRRAFIQCDDDLSHEIETNLLSPTASNILMHYYLSLSVSGSCATVAIIYNNLVFVASTGDCRAVMGELRSELLTPGSGTESTITTTSPTPFVRKTLKAVDLSNEHNSDNISELNRIMAQHPKEEHNHIIRENRLLGQLMPLRAFGDFSFKWSVDKMKQLGLTRAFGSHIIPTHYRTPPYLTAEPEIITLDLLEDNCGDGSCDDESEHPNEKTERIRLDRFIVLATDGLWEQFESARKVIKAVNRYRQNVRKHVKAYASADLFSNTDGQGDDQNVSTLGQIADRLKQHLSEQPTGQQYPVTTFERVTADDDLIEDINCGTFLLRIALSDISSLAGVSTPNPGNDEEKFSHHVDQYEQQRARHAKLVSYLTLPQSVVRNFRDDISLIVIGLK